MWPFSGRHPLYECRLSITIVVFIHRSCLANWFSGLVVRVYICPSVCECVCHCAGILGHDSDSAPKMAIHSQLHYPNHWLDIVSSTKGSPFILLSGNGKKENNWASERASPKSHIFQNLSKSRLCAQWLRLTLALKGLAKWNEIGYLIHAPFHLHNSHTAVLIRTNLLAIIHWPDRKRKPNPYVVLVE